MTFAQCLFRDTPGVATGRLGALGVARGMALLRKMGRGIDLRAEVSRGHGSLAVFDQISFLDVLRFEI